ncbi:HlyD family secretion protein [Neomoorella thermoacetica]|uniref:HlyD family secretion protein n=1 Tax=Neomoorella thermoacetica TaxID=1525 RepID=UPI0008FBB0F6|nr:efflux RND transporter periplasmic adaptor subunit [Moorella thermoacetica]OIQ62758.1 multidrug resistance protein MdtN [Moorella thermoacetica]
MLVKKWPPLLKRLLIAGAIIFAGVAFALISRSPKPATVGIYEGHPVLYGSGVIETTEIGVGAEIPGRIRQVLVQEGQFVTAGSIIAVLDDAELQGQVAQAKAAVAGAEAQLAQVRAVYTAEQAGVEGNIQMALAALQKLTAGARQQEIDAAQKKVDQARAKLQSAQEQLRRMETLHQQGVISDEQYQQAKTNYEVARADLGAAEDNLSLLASGSRPEDIAAARANYEVALAGRSQVEARRKDVDAAAAALDKAKAALKTAEEQLAKATIRAKTSGVVLRCNFSAGEVVNPGIPIVTLSDPADLWLAIYVPETEIGKVKVGQQAVVTVDSFPGKRFNGRVKEIAGQAEFTPKNIQTKEERVDLVFKVKISLANEEQLLKPGMPADAMVYLDSQEAN